MDLMGKDLEFQLKEAGSRLIDPPASPEELLPILDQVESCLLKVEQSPSSSMQEALSPSLNALVDDKILRHSDLDVKVAVASCISEITRITAPNAPYDDDQMKEVFQLIVSSFENLSDQSGRSYMKRISILETVAKVRSCVVMLDLECDALIIKMFQYFLNSIRDYHPKNVFSSMETIMSLVLEESEDIPPEFLSPILECVKNDNKEVLPIAKKLGERILESCANKVRPYMSHAVQTLGSSVDNYSGIVASLCQEARDSVGQNDVSAADHVANESKPGRPSSEEAENANKGEEKTAKESTSLQVDPTSHNSPKSVMTNGNVQAGESNHFAESNTQKKQEDHDLSDQVEGKTVSRNENPDNLDERKTEDSGKMQEECSKEGERKSSSSKSAASLDSLPLDKETESEKPADSEVDNKDVCSFPLQDSSVSAAVVEVNDKDSGVNISSAKAENGVSEVIASSSLSKNPADVNCTESGRAEKKEGSAKEDAETSRKISDQTSDSEVKPSKLSVKGIPGSSTDEIKTPTDEIKTATDEIKTPNVAQSSKKGPSKSAPEMKRQMSKKVGAANKSRVVDSSKLSQEQKKQSQTHITSEKRTSKSYKEDNKVPSLSPTKLPNDAHGETSKTNLKRKHLAKTEKESKAKELGEEIIGSKIRVWWPKDKMFYEGVVDSFDPGKKKHKIAYIDGDIEVLNLKREKYLLLVDESYSDKEEESDSASTETSSDLPLKKKSKVAIALELDKQVKMDASPNSAGGTGSKSKGASSKASGKSKDGSKGGKSEEPKSVNKSTDHASKSVSGSKLKDAGASKYSKLNDGAISTPGLSVKSKQETPRIEKTKGTPITVSTSKVKTTKSFGKFDSNGTGNVKSSLPKKREREAMNESTSSNAKGKSPNVSKAQASKVKTEKKRGRS